MRIRFLAFAAVAVLLAWASQAQEKTENPFRNAKVGDYVTYKMTVSIMGKDTEATMKETVIAKNDKELTLKSITTPTIKGKGESEEKIDLTKPYDPIAYFFRNDKQVKCEKTAEGKEKIKVGDKTYECNWIAGKATWSIGDIAVKADLKFWFSKSVPLSGLVALEAKADRVNI